MLGLNIAHLCTKFDHSSFSRSTDMVDAHQNLNGSRDPTTHLAGIVCNDQSVYHIWIIYLHPLRGYEGWYKMSKMGWFWI